MEAAILLKLIAEGVPLALRLVEEARSGKLPTEAEWAELRTLASYTSAEALAKAQASRLP